MAYIIFSSIAAAMHIFFFILESILWDKPQGLKIFQNTPEQASTQKLMAFNQGFYNLFLAGGVIYGLVTNDLNVTVFCLLCMISAGFVLLLSKKELWRGAALQAIPPFFALFLKWFFS